MDLDQLAWEWDKKKTVDVYATTQRALNFILRTRDIIEGL